MVIRNHMLLSSAILEYSRVQLYSAVYICLKPYWKAHNIDFKIQYYDTDGILFTAGVDYETALSHLPNLMLNGVKLCDMSFLSPDHLYFSNEMKNVPGSFKSEVGNHHNYECVSEEKSIQLTARRWREIKMQGSVQKRTSTRF